MDDGPRTKTIVEAYDVIEAQGTRLWLNAFAADRQTRLPGPLQLLTWLYERAELAATLATRQEGQSMPFVDVTDVSSPTRAKTLLASRPVRAAGIKQDVRTFVVRIAAERIARAGVGVKLGDMHPVDPAMRCHTVEVGQFRGDYVVDASYSTDTTPAGERAAGTD